MGRFRKQCIFAQCVDDLALFIHHIVKVKSPFTDPEVLLFHPALSGLNGFVEPGVLEFVSFLQSETVKDLDDTVGTEKTHKVVFKRDIELGGTGVALTGTASPQLAVDAPGVVTGTADDMESPQFGNTGSQLDIGTASSHVGGDGDGAGAAGIGDDLSFTLVVFGVEDVVGDLADRQHP